MAVLWSGFLALWCDRARRRALPLLLATLILLVPSFPAQADCTCVGEGPHAAHHHEEDEACEHHHEEEEAAAQRVERGANSTSPTIGHAHLAAWSQIASARTGTSCCSCPRAPLGTPVVSAAVPAPSQASADTQTLVYVRANVFPPFATDALTGLFGRAGPPGSKPKLVFLASLPGRAPPVSL